MQSWLVTTLKNPNTDFGKSTKSGSKYNIKLERIVLHWKTALNTAGYPARKKIEG